MNGSALDRLPSGRSLKVYATLCNPLFEGYLFACLILFSNQSKAKCNGQPIEKYHSFGSETTVIGASSKMVY